MLRCWEKMQSWLRPLFELGLLLPAPCCQWYALGILLWAHNTVSCTNRCLPLRNRLAGPSCFSTHTYSSSPIQWTLNDQHTLIEQTWVWFTVSVYAQMFLNSSQLRIIRANLQEKKEKIWKKISTEADIYKIYKFNTNLSDSPFTSQTEKKSAEHDSFLGKMFWTICCPWCFSWNLLPVNVSCSIRLKD